MRRIFVIGVLLVCASFLITGSIYAQAQDTTALFGELKEELQNKGINLEDVRAVEQPLKSMLRQGATKDELKNAVLDLSKRGIKGEELRNSVNSMNELVKSGMLAKEAGNVVSQAAHQAWALGLRGKDLAAKVREAARQRKTEMVQMKTKMQEQQKQTQRKAGVMKKDMDREIKKQHKMMDKSMAPYMKGHGAGKDKK